MQLDLSNIIEVPGASLSFDCELAPEKLLTSSIIKFLSPPKASGQIANTAGILTLRGEISSVMTCVCDRCFSEYNTEKTIPVVLALASADEIQDEGNPDIFPVVGDHFDLPDALETVFILESDTKSLCREDCAGLCETCGVDLNLGPCSCRPEIDPRLAVLGQLLDNSDN